jgi:S1-C subfamily serine protease
VAVRTFIFALGALIAAVGELAFAGAPDGAVENSSDQAVVAALQRTLVNVIRQAEPSVVAVARSSPAAQQAILAQPAADLFADLRQQQNAGEPSSVSTGVIIDASGLVLTEFLAVREGDRHTITTIDGQTYPATVKAADPRSGLAVLAASALPLPAENAGNTNKPAQFQPLPFGDASQLQKGQFVIAIGNPYAIRSDGEPTAAWGTVTNLARKAPPGANLNDAPGLGADYRTTLHHLGTLIQTDAKLGWSAGGGALIDMHGELVGLTTTISAIAGYEQPAGYAIPIDPPIRRIIDTLKQGREVEYGLLGIGFQPGAAGTGAASSGAIVQQVYPGGPAAKAGLQPNDIITQIAGQAVTDVDRLQLLVSQTAPSQSIAVNYLRAGHAATADVVLSKLAVAGTKIMTEQPPAWRGIHVDYALALDAPTLGQESAIGAIDPEGCVRVSGVEQNSPAWTAGVRPGMFISHVGKRRVTTPDEFRSAVADSAGSLELRMTQPIQHRDSGDGNQLSVPAAQ